MSDAVDRYDPTEPEDRKKQTHISKRDLIILSIVVAVLLVFGVPIFQKLMQDRNKHICKDNLGKISQAILSYVEQNNGRLPPVYAMDSNYSPILNDKGEVNTWMSVLALDIDKPETSFICPSADHEEFVHNEGPNGTSFSSTYGMFAALSAKAISDIPNPAGVAMISETANQGANDTFNPLPMLGEDGNPKPDGFMIGFGKSNFYPSDQNNVYTQCQYATRLAFYGSKDGKFDPEGPTRHIGGIHVLFPDRHVKTFKAPLATIQRIGKQGEIINRWQLR